MAPPPPTAKSNPSPPTRTSSTPATHQQIVAAETADHIVAPGQSEGLRLATTCPYAAFQRRNLHLVEDKAEELITLFAWQDIVRVDVEGIWLEVLAVSLQHQHKGTGRTRPQRPTTVVAPRDRRGI